MDVGLLGVAESLQPHGESQLSCTGPVNSFDSLAVPGSNEDQGSRGTYGPWRSQPTFFKLRGGGLHSTISAESHQSNPGAPSSSTSGRTFTGTANHGTPRDRLARLLLSIMDDDDHPMHEEVLTPGQQALYDLCKHDLWTSCRAFEAGWNRAQGQQFLVDLKRMEPSSTSFWHSKGTFHICLSTFM